MPEDCLVFEDILAAVKSAKSAGMGVCAVYDKTSENDWEEIKKAADYAIVDFRDAPLPRTKVRK
jgi:beta-phosphoglucomutase-like phosphatase (HAD superfamily)